MKKEGQFCNDKEIAQSMIRDQIVIVIHSDSKRVKLLGDNQTFLAKDEQMCRASERATLRN